MCTKIIQCNRKEKIDLTLEDKAKGLNVALVDEKGATIAKYSFDAEKLKDLDYIDCQSSDVRISFDGITPTTKCELGSSPSI